MQQYFGTDGVRGHVGKIPMTVDYILKLGWAAGRVLTLDAGHSTRRKILIGKDTRVSGYLFESALQAGLTAAGVDCLLLGPMPTPAVSYLTRILRASAGIVISASHNPYYDNGIKFFSHDGIKISDEIEFAIEKELEKPIITVESEFLGKAQRMQEMNGRYIEFCKSTFPSTQSLAGLKIVLDCANGATYHIAPYVFNELGAEVYEIGVEPNGFNINEKCGSIYPDVLVARVLAEKADVGIALDGDGDRVAMVDHLGEIIDGDEMLFIIAKWYADTNRLTGGVVGTLMSNFGLEEALKTLGIEFYRAPIGDRHVMEMLYKMNWNLGGEQSGHLMCLDINTAVDGIISALRVLGISRLTGKTIAELKQGMKKYPQLLINIPVTDPIHIMDHAMLKSTLLKVETALQGKGRVLLRPSGTESVIRVMVEGRDMMLIQTLAEELKALVIRLDKVATS
jgi:phosphoglucosamine mutase